jgi:hypothetical protein
MPEFSDVSCFRRGLLFGQLFSQSIEPDVSDLTSRDLDDGKLLGANDPNCTPETPEGDWSGETPPKELSGPSKPVPDRVRIRFPMCILLGWLRSYRTFRHCTSKKFGEYSLGAFD